MTLQTIVEAAGTVAVEQFCSDNLPVILDALLTGNKGPLNDVITASGANPTANQIRSSVPFIPKPVIWTKRPNVSPHFKNELLPSVVQPAGLDIRIAPCEIKMPEGAILELLVRRHRGKWAHPVNSPSSIVSRSKFYAGMGNYSWDPVNSDMSIPVVTEWVASVSSIQLYPVQWYGCLNYRGQLTMPLKVVDWDTAVGAKTKKSRVVGGIIVKNPTKRILFKFRYSIIDPNGNGTTDRITGPESDILMVYPEIGTFDDGIIDQKYYWRFAAKVATK